MLSRGLIATAVGLSLVVSSAVQAQDAGVGADAAIDPVLDAGPVPLGDAGPDDDLDGDGVPNGSDNCPSDANAAQSNQDGDAEGDACDDDDDNDGVPDFEDNCPLDDNAEQADGDDDGIGDACDRDLGFTDDGGCACDAGGGRPDPAWLLLAVALLSTMRRRRLCASLCAVVLCASTAARADTDAHLIPERNSLAVGAVLGVFLPDDEHEFYDPDKDQKPLNPAGIALGLRIGYTAIEYIALEAEVELIPIGTDDGEGATLFGVRAQVVLQYPARITPFVSVGGGTMAVLSGDSALGDDADAVAHLGAGAMVFLKPRLALRIDGRLIRAPRFEVMPPGGEGTNHYSVLFGAAWTFGREAQPEPTPTLLSKPEPATTTDSDGDGIDDSADECPSDAETSNGFDDFDGCPDEVPDEDNDGIRGAADQCPSQAEDFDQFEDEDGCPELDNDGDGVADLADRCPIQAGPADNSGCPVPDRDSDGVADRIDNCPDEAGTAEQHGCVAAQLVIIEKDRLQLLDKIQFASDRADISARSHPLLDNIAAVLSSHPEIAKVRVEGHTDDMGEAEHNKNLSQRRADAVVKYLVGKGVASERLEAVGIGEASPIADNRTNEGRTANRRVELVTTAGDSALELESDSPDDGE